MFHGATEVLEEDKWGASCETEVAVGEFDALGLNELCFGCLLSSHNGFDFILCKAQCKL